MNEVQIETREYPAAPAYRWHSATYDMPVDGLGIALVDAQRICAEFLKAGIPSHARVTFSFPKVTATWQERV